MVADKVTFIDDPAGSQQLAAGLGMLTAATEATEAQPARLLHRLLATAPKLHELEDILWHQRRLSLRQLARALWDSDDATAERATVRLLQLSASARREPHDRPLVAHRIHVLTRAADGLHVCLDAACSGPSNHRLEPLGAVQAGGATSCRWCKSAALSLYRCFQCGHELLGGRQERQHLFPVLTDDEDLVLLSPQRPADAERPAWSIDPRTGEARGAGATTRTLYIIERCPGCEAPLSKASRSQKDARSFRTENQVAISIVVESALAELPPFPSPDIPWLPGRGRRLHPLGAHSLPRRRLVRAALSSGGDPPCVKPPPWPYALATFVQYSQLGCVTPLEAS